MKRLLAPPSVLLFLAALLPLRAATSAALPDGLYAEFTSTRGVVTAQLYFEKTPMTCASFVGLAEDALAAKDGQPFYTGLKWYRVVPGFVIQSGDPTNPGGGTPERPGPRKKTEEEGHPYTYPDELVPGLRHDAAGVLSMANAGPDTNSCEFFVTLAPAQRLNYLHSVFGHVVRGLEVLPKIQADDPFSIKILRVGAAAQAFKADGPAFSTLLMKAKPYAFAAEPGPAAHFYDPHQLLPLDPPRAKAFNYKLANFERITGVRITARLLARSPPDTDGRKLNAFVHNLAGQLGVGKSGALVLYLADRDEWKLWLGDDSAPAFMDRTGTVRDFMQAGALHEAKQALLNAGRAQGDADFVTQQKSSAPGKAPPPAQRLKLQTDAVLDGLIQKLEPK
ncbi:MAG: peptidylprolyl isomerase [Opitutus sp.]|nr:peptidylprolyl isomerase [Opitutus sp.]